MASIEWNKIPAETKVILKSAPDKLRRSLGESNAVCEWYETENGETVTWRSATARQAQSFLNRRVNGTSKASR